jgi:hypothetical protein
MYKSAQIKLVFTNLKTNNESMSKLTAIVRMEGNSKRGRPRERWTDQVEWRRKIKSDTH